MKKPYGKRPGRSRSATGQQTPRSEAFKIRIRGKDDAPLSMPELQQGLYEAVKALLPHGAIRAKRATIYLNLVDQDGQGITLNRENELTIFPYRSILDERGA